MHALIVRVCLAATITGSALAALREYHEAALGASGSVWAPLPGPDVGFYDSQDDVVLLPLALRLIPFLVDVTLQTPYIKPCKRSDPDINACITNSIETLRSKLAEGIPELEAPAIEPLNLDQIRLLRGPTGARLDINVTGLQVFGPSTFKIRDLRADVDDVTFTFKVGFGKLQFKGKYAIDARLLLLRLAGSGDLTGNFTGYESDVVLHARKVYRNGDVYLNFEKMKLAITIGSAKVYLSNLFGGDPILGPASNEILNANSAIFLDELRPVLESSLSDLFTNVANKITESFTYDELFPKD